MLCPYCKTAAQIMAARTRVTGDASPDTPTEVTLVQEFACRNPQCAHRGEVIGTAEHTLYRGE